MLRYTHKRMAVPAASQWARNCVVRVRRVDFAVELAADRPFRSYRSRSKSRSRFSHLPRPARNAPAWTFKAVVAAHLFGVAGGRSDAQDPDNAPQSSANLLLAGTIATQDPKHGVAIISEGGAPSKVYSVGERVGGASLHSVYLDHVILDRGGALETLLLPRQLPAVRRRRRPSPGAFPAATRAPRPRSTTFGRWCSRTPVFWIK